MGCLIILIIVSIYVLNLFLECFLNIIWLIAVPALGWAGSVPPTLIQKQRTGMCSGMRGRSGLRPSGLVWLNIVPWAAHPQQKPPSQVWRLGFLGWGAYTVSCWGRRKLLDFLLWQEKGQQALRGSFLKNIFYGSILDVQRANFCCCCCSVAQSCPTLGDPWTAARRPPYPPPSPGICSTSCLLSRWCYPCCTAKWSSYTGIYIFLFIFFPLRFITGYWIQLPVLHKDLVYLF